MCQSFNITTANFASRVMIFSSSPARNAMVYNASSNSGDTPMKLVPTNFSTPL